MIFTTGFILSINGYNLKAPISVEITHNKIWSKNTGRSASGLMVGDIIARKYSLSISMADMKQEDVTALDEAINTDAFFLVKFVNHRGNTVEANFYSSDPTYKQTLFKNSDVYYDGPKIELIEQ